MKTFIIEKIVMDYDANWKAYITDISYNIDGTIHQFVRARIANIDDLSNLIALQQQMLMKERVVIHTWENG